MGRKRINPNEKRKMLKVHIPVELYDKFLKKRIKNRSKFFNGLLERFFGIINENVNKKIEI